jgi:serine/threonine-protein kinase
VVAALDAVTLRGAAGASGAARALPAVMDAMARFASLARATLARRSVVPNWVMLAGIPLVFVMAWLLFRSPAGPARDEGSSSQRRVEAIVAGTAPSEPPASSPGRATPAPGSSSAEEATASGLDAAAARARLREVSKTRDWPRATKAIEALVALDPAALRDPNVVPGIVSVAVALEATGGADADTVFDLLTNRAGTDGLDILFEMVRTRGGTKGGKRAAEVLRQPEIVAREPAALRIAFELREAPCDKKPGLYERAVKEGDGRTVTELRVMRAAECDRRRRRDDPCCFDHTALDRAISDLRERLKE